MMNNLLAAAFVILAIMQWNWRFLLGAMYFGWIIQWGLRALAREDPQWWQVYRQYVKKPLVREP